MIKMFRFLLGLTAALTITHNLSAEDEHHTDLGDKMKKMGDAFKKVRKQVDDPAKNEDSLQQVAIIKEIAQSTKDLKPEKTADLPEAEQEKFVADYKKGMDEFLAEVGKLETALKANDNAAAKESVTKLNDLQKADHKQFRKPQKKSGG